MAFTLKIRMTASIIDKQNVEALCTTYALVDPTANFSTIITTYYAWLTALDAVTDGRIVRAQFAVYPDLPYVKGAPGDASNVSQTAVLSFTGPSSPRRDAVAVPALKDSLLDGQGIITGSGVVATFINLLQSGGSSLEPATSDWDAPLTFKDSALSFRQYNRQREPNTFVLA